MAGNPLWSVAIMALFSVLLLLFWPIQGVFWRWLRARQKTERVLVEDALKHIYEMDEDGRRPTVQSIAGALDITTARAAGILAQMIARELLVARTESYQLTAEGRDYALHIIRAHRLWEHQEHELSKRDVDALAAQLSYPTHDPHGDPIPPSSGALPLETARPLMALHAGQLGRVVHLEDEPSELYVQLVAEGLYVGMELRLIEHNDREIRFWAEGCEHVLTPVLAANISVLPLPLSSALEPEASVERLCDLPVGAKAQIKTIAAACRGGERRRLLDLGILPGTLVEAAFSSPSGNPTAYRVRGALIALRREQANHIHIERVQELVHAAQ
jgi:DtxR family Mn-dependent transcriptional regulator